jgi:uncharacterized protein YqjF (DUF2071 family)
MAMRPFLTADWRHLAMLNYAVDRAMLEPFVPAGTELDLWQGRALVSLVGFRFLKTRLQGWTVPFHQDFSEVNLRFYVRREGDDGWRRGVVFLKEIAPKFAVSWIANALYHEHYVTLPMWRRIQLPASPLDRSGRIVYGWRRRQAVCELQAEFSGLPRPLERGSEEEFVAEHYWGYTRRRDGTTVEFRVEHPPWRIWKAERAAFTGEASELYGAALARVLRGAPSSALVAEGSKVTMFYENGGAQRAGAVPLSRGAASLSSPERSR